MNKITGTAPRIQFFCNSQEDCRCSDCLRLRRWSDARRVRGDLLDTIPLVDQTLRGVDPWEVKLTEDVKVRILEESRVNSEFFFQVIMSGPAT